MTFTKWGGVEYETTSDHGPQCNFRPGNTTSARGIQLPSTVDNFRQHLLHHNNSFIAFSTNELKLRGLRRGKRRGGSHFCLGAQVTFRNEQIQTIEVIQVSHERIDEGSPNCCFSKHLQRMNLLMIVSR